MLLARSVEFELRLNPVGIQKALQGVEPVDQVHPRGAGPQSLMSISRRSVDMGGVADVDAALRTSDATVGLDGISTCRALLCGRNGAGRRRCPVGTRTLSLQFNLC